MLCPRCGREVGEFAVLCPECGRIERYRAAQGEPTPGIDHHFVPSTQGPQWDLSPKHGGFAGFWMRVAAMVMDSAILGVLTLAAVMVAGQYFLESIAQGLVDRSTAMQLAAAKDMATISIGLFVIQLGVPWLYFAVLESSPMQATPGKAMIGIYVMRTNGQRPSFLRASGRYFGKMLSSLPFGIGFLMAGFTARKQALHDMTAGCLVVRHVGATWMRALATFMLGIVLTAVVAAMSAYVMAQLFGEHVLEELAVRVQHGMPLEITPRR